MSASKEYVTVFEHLKQFEVKASDTLAMELTHEAFGSEPITLKGVYAGTTNKAYNNAVLKWAAVERKKSRDGIVKVGDVSDEHIAQKDALDRRLFPLHVITGWEGVKDAGKDVPFSQDACVELFKHLPVELFYIIRNTFSDPGNFRSEVSSEDAKTKGKN